ncbi:hypothetical protein SERLA73DRAFT_153681 [Serpula lacrymans var. lacrymans S7.3]|uniref:ABM domain-containing protein n=1 Tax=Serpula lacrymans var. lacrymans (strain S7.3) TaxID=936435 RepID=F8Q1Y3_SERL3|nr:hypothetical protein SERLA73DRAFT_153681 [Serpula lacrymans var. lacrymans S7.3]
MPAIKGVPEMIHALFKDYPSSAFSAPVVEFAFATLKEGKAMKELGRHLDQLTDQDTKTVVSATWGPVLENRRETLMIVGWQSIEEAAQNGTPEIGNLIEQIMELSTLLVKHAVLQEY